MKIFISEVIPLATYKLQRIKIYKRFFFKASISNVKSENLKPVLRSAVTWFVLFNRQKVKLSQFHLKKSSGSE